MDRETRRSSSSDRARRARRGGRALGDRLLMPVLMVLAVIASLASWVLIARDGSQRVDAELERVAAANAAHRLETIRVWADRAIDDVRFWAEDATVTGSTVRLLDVPVDRLDRSDAQRALRDRLRPFLDLSGRAGYFVTTLDGVNLASSRDSNLGDRFLVAERFPDVFADVVGGMTRFTPPQVTDVPLVPDSDELTDTMFVASPIRDGGEVVAVFSLRLNPTENLAPLVRDLDPDDGAEIVFTTTSRPIVAPVDLELTEEVLVGGMTMAKLVARDDAGSLRDTDVSGLGRQRVVAWAYDREIDVGSLIVLDSTGAAAGVVSARNVLIVGSWIGIFGLAWLARTTAARRTTVRDRDRFARRYQSLVDPSPDPIIRLRPNGELTDFNPSAGLLLALSDSDLGRTISRSDVHPLLAFLGARWSHVASATGPTVINEIRWIDVDGSTVYYQARIAPVDVGADDGEILVSFNDSTEQVRREAQLERLALTDSLTGLPNRAALHDRLEVSLRRLRRPTDGDGVAILMIDIDHFKTVNDTLGHAAGDALLVEVGAVLTDFLRVTDTVGRLGGDEFLIIGERVAAKSTADELAERVRAHVRDLTLAIGESEITIAASVGLAWTQRYVEPDELIARADRAMMRQKTHHGIPAGDGDLDGDFPVSLSEEEWVLGRSLFGALERDEFRLHYQPIVGVGGEIVGVEALLRWQHPERGLLGPKSFLRPLVEAGLIGPVGHWSVTQAIAAAIAWQAAATPLVVHVNLSPIELATAGVDVLKHQIDTTGVDPTLLCVELTEHAFRGAAISTSSIAALGESGVRVALDDFGMGVSSIAHLRNRTLHAIKLDRALVAGLGDSADRSIVSGVLEIASALGLEVVAEGVETREQFEWLVDAGCERFQGWLFGRAVPVDEIVPGARLGPVPGDGRSTGTTEIVPPR